MAILRACKAFRLHRSSYYYQPRPADDQELRRSLREAARKRRRWGYRRLIVLLRREGFSDNHKRIERVYREENLQVGKRRKRKARLWRGQLQNTPQRPRERYSMDFMQDSTACGHKVRILNVMDDFTRECLAVEIDTSLTGSRVARVLDRVIDLYGKPERMLSDNGPEFTGGALDAWAYRNGISLDFIEPGKPNQNAIMESFNGKMRDECLNENWFYNIREARRIIEAWREDYNTERPHSAIGYLTPLEYFEKMKTHDKKTIREGGEISLSLLPDQLTKTG